MESERRHLHAGHDCDDLRAHWEAFKDDDGTAIKMTYQFAPVALSAIARRFGLRLLGADREVSTLALIRPGLAAPENALTFASNSTWLLKAEEMGFSAVIADADLDENAGTQLPTLLSHGSSRVNFYDFYDWTVSERLWIPQQTRISSRASVASSAVVMPGVVLDDDVVVEPGAVIYGNTTVGRGALIKANAVVGGQGFQIREVGSRRKLVPHMGGVYVGRGASVGSCTCIDRGLFGDVTHVGAYTMVDNLVHIAHNVILEDDVTVVASAEISGSVIVGRGSWVGPGARINPGITLGCESFVGSGSTVVKDVARNTLVLGTPARPQRLVCACRSPLRRDEALLLKCESCGKSYCIDEIERMDS